MNVVLIAAVAKNGVIGCDGGMPWHYPEDLQHFKTRTMGCPVIAGRKTHESIVSRIGEPLPGRASIVLTRGDIDAHQRVQKADSIDHALSIAEDTGSEDVFVIGGGSVYEQFLEKADRLVLTELKQAYEGDTRFPEWNEQHWKLCSEEEHSEFYFREYIRRD